MTISITPLTPATGGNNPNRQVSVNVWNAGHEMSGTARKGVVFDGSGDATETDPPVVNPVWFGASEGADDNRAAIQSAINHAATIKGRVVFPALFKVAPPSEGSAILDLSNASGVKLSGQTPACGLKVKDNAGNYAAVIDLTGSSVSDVLIENLTIDENAANNGTGTPTAGDATKTLFAIKCYAATQRRIRVKGCHFKNCPGINTVALNSADNRYCEVSGNHFSFQKPPSGANYDNSAIYINGSHYTVHANTLEVLSAAGTGRSGIEVHGWALSCTGNKVIGYQAGINFVSTNLAQIEDTYSSVQGNTITACEQGVVLWPITGTSLSYFDISGNNIEVDNNLYPSSVNFSGGITAVTTTGVLGTIEKGSIHHNTINHAAFVGNGSNPDNDSAGIFLDLAAGGVIRDVYVTDNIVRNAPNLGISLYQRSGTMQRVYCKRNHVIDAGHNVANSLRAAIMWRGAVGDCDCELVDNRLIDTGTPSPKGNLGFYTFFLTAGKLIEQGNTQIIATASNYLTNRSSQFSTEEKVYALAWSAAPAIVTRTGARLFTLDMTSAIAATMGIDSVSQPTCPPNTRIRIRIKNSSGGAPTLNWNAGYKLAGGAFATPAAGTTTTIEFVTPDGGATWHETSRVNVTH